MIWLQQAPVLHEADHDITARVHGHAIPQTGAVGAILALQVFMVRLELAGQATVACILPATDLSAIMGTA